MGGARSAVVAVLLACTLAVPAAVAPSTARAIEATGSVDATPVTSVPEPSGAGAVRVEDSDRRLEFSGMWHYRWDVRASGHSRRAATRSGARVTLRFDGTGVSLVAPRGPRGGQARVTLDGEPVATVSLYAPEPTSPATVWISGPIPSGTHKLVVAALGSAEASSVGTVVSIDAFDVEGTVLRSPKAGARTIQQDDARIHLTGGWTRRSSASASGDSALRTSRARSSVTVRFRGTSFAWLGRTSPDHGRAAVYLDGKRVATVGGAPGPARESAVLWAASGLSDRTHTVTIRALGEPSGVDAATGTGIDVDAFVIDGDVLFAPRPTPFAYPWRNYLVVDKSSFTLSWVKNGTLIKVYPIAHGKVGWTTPNRVWRIDAKYHSSGVYGPRKMRMFRQAGSRFIRTNYAIHGTNQEWVIGTRASRGCIRMYNRDVLELFPQVPIGTMVVTRD